MGYRSRYIFTLALMIAVVGSTTGSSQLRDGKIIVVPDDALIITGGTVLDGTGRIPIPEGVVVVEGNRIVAIGSEADLRIPSSARVLDARGGTIMPGIINSHVHHGAPAALRHQFLMEGCTTICDLGSELGEMSQFTETSCSEGPAARGLRAGPIITAPGGYPDGLYGTRINYEVATPDEGRTAVRDLAGRGTDVIKIALDPSWNFDNPLPVLDLLTVQAIVAEAHDHDLIVRAHLIQPPQLALAIAGGVDVVEHLAMPRWPAREEVERVMASENPISLFFDRWAPEYQPQLEHMAELGMAMVPTVSSLLREEYTKADPTPRESWVVDVVLDIVRRFHEAGGTVAVGNDFNDRSTKERLPLLEMEMLLQAGLSSMDVIIAATRNAARVCGVAAELGTLEPGMLADIVVVEGDPLTDLIGALGRVRIIIKDGVIVHDSDADLSGDRGSR